MIKRWLRVGVLLVMASSCLNIYGQPNLKKSVVDNGGIISRTDSLQLRISIGQSVSGQIQSNPEKGTLGFLTSSVINNQDSFKLLSKKLETSLYLSQNYPNPFDQVTTFFLTLSRSDYVEMNIYNIKGEKVVTLIDNQVESGDHLIHWDAGQFPSGIYHCRFISGKNLIMKKMLLIR